MKTSLYFRGSMLALMLTGLTGCSKPSAQAAPETGAKKPRVALVIKSLANEFFGTMAAGARQHQARHSADYELISNGIKNETDLAEQVSLVEQMIAMRITAKPNKALF